MKTKDTAWSTNMKTMFTNWEFTKIMKAVYKILYSYINNNLHTWINNKCKIKEINILLFALAVVAGPY